MLNRLHQIVTAAYTVWPFGSVPYTQTAAKSPTGHRQDCSGFVSAVLGLPTPGLTTVTFVTNGVIHQLNSWSEAVPGDFWGKCGVRTDGSNGHIGVIVGTPTTDGAWVIIDHGSGNGPKKRTFSSPPTDYKPYRLVGVEPAGMLGDRILALGATGSDVAALQTALKNKGYDLGSFGPNHDGVDGDFGKMTGDAVKAFQSSVSLSPTGVVNAQTLHMLWGVGASPVSKNDLIAVTTGLSSLLDTVHVLADRL